MTTYRKAGVDIRLADRFTEFLQKKSKAIGGFAGVFPLRETGGEFSVVASTDGVGTKLKLAFLLDRHDTVGVDLVAMCVNDLLCCGAKPLFFLDYYATPKLDLRRSKKVIDGILEGCRQSGCALLGGETAELPGFYKPGEYDLAGFSVGLLRRGEEIDGRGVRPGDALVGLPSTGFHSNGYSLIRAVMKGAPLKKHARALLTPTKIYVRDIAAMRAALRRSGHDILGLSHITGSGIPGNLPRFFPKGVSAVMRKGSWKIPAVMRLVQEKGRISDSEMFDTFNMGLGMIAAVRPGALKTALRSVPGALHVGEVVRGRGEVLFS
ncbi:MAG: phosphoribosylformylglycinamidine cyclo-ligase [Elusimicrobiales bacterium]|nr:phosphoribosylformylglycinamidine cyclo-ligase [Elusimicrobiales bacterium]